MGGTVRSTIRELLDQPLPEQAEACCRRLGLPCDYETAQAHASDALARLGGATPDDWLAAAGIAVAEVDEDHRIGTLARRAVLDLAARRITLYRRAIAEMEAAAADLPLPVPLRQVALCHETFHAIASHCPRRHAELAAHLFATRALGLPFCAALLDVATLRAADPRP